MGRCVCVCFSLALYHSFPLIVWRESGPYAKVFNFGFFIILPAGRGSGEEADRQQRHQVPTRQTGSGADPHDLRRGEHEEGHGGV